VPAASAAVDPELHARLQQLGREIGAAGVPLASFLALYAQRYGSSLQAADRSELLVQNLIRK
jgi:hypothetical protein